MVDIAISHINLKMLLKWLITIRKLQKLENIHQKTHIQNAQNIQTKERFVIKQPVAIMKALKDAVNLKTTLHLVMTHRKPVILMKAKRDVVNMVIQH